MENTYFRIHPSSDDSSSVVLNSKQSSKSNFALPDVYLYHNLVDPDCRLLDVVCNNKSLSTPRKFQGVLSSTYQGFCNFSRKKFKLNAAGIPPHRHVSNKLI